MSQLRKRYSNEEATISGAKAIHERQSRLLFYYGTSKLQSRQELMKVSQRESELATGSDTSQSIDSPLLELFECDLSRGGNFVQAQAVRVVLLFEFWRSKLFLSVINGTSPFGINSTVVLFYHDCFRQSCKWKAALDKLICLRRDSRRVLSISS